MKTVSEILFGKASRLICAALLVFCLLQPPDGLGIDLCLFHRITGLPCVGCGLTRSVSNVFKGHFVRALDYHPYGYLVAALFLAVVLYEMFPAGYRRRVDIGLAAHERSFRFLYLAFVWTFIAFGLGRMGYILLQEIAQGRLSPAISML